MQKPSHILILPQAAPFHLFPKVRKGPHFFAEMGMVAQELVQFCYVLSFLSSLFIRSTKF